MKPFANFADDKTINLLVCKARESVLKETKA